MTADTQLLALSLKLIVPSLTKLCEQFLMTHASGRPVMAIALAEQHGNAELYREASRFLLDQPTWDPEEFESLSETTQLKLSKRCVPPAAALTSAARGSSSASLSWARST